MSLDMRPIWMRAVWSTAYVNSLPDSSFLLVYTDAKGAKQRMFPVRDADGKVDVAHLNNALARIPQASTLTADQRMAAMAKAKKLAAANPDIGSGKTAQYEGTAGSGRSRFVDFDVPSEALGMQTRTFELIMELRSSGDGRTLFGRAVPYGVNATVNQGGKSFQERFVPGVFSRQVGSGQIAQVRLFDAHADRMNGQHPIGKTTRLAEQPDGLYGEWALNDTTRAEDALKLVRAGEVTGLSVGFKAQGGGTRRADDGTLERVSAHLDHVALTHEPVYADAQVLGVRSAAVRELEADRERFRLLVR
jgi:Escherichia/Staphylococcus phage prohead protease